MAGGLRRRLSGRRPGAHTATAETPLAAAVAEPRRRTAGEAAGRWCWCAVAALLGAGAALAALGPGTSAAALDWQPGLAWREPWRAWSAAFVHYGRLHLAANAAGLLLVAALGIVARLPPRSALAWAAAWPLTQLGLLAEPALAHYGGLSGVLHAGVAAAALHLAWRGAGARRGIGVLLLAGLLLKVLAEAPWAAVLRHPPGWGIAVAPAAHACGAAAGLLCAAVAEALAGRRLGRRTRRRSTAARAARHGRLPGGARPSP